MQVIFIVDDEFEQVVDCCDALKTFDVQRDEDVFLVAEVVDRFRAEFLGNIAKYEKVKIKVKVKVKF